MNVNFFLIVRPSLIKKKNGLFQHFVGYEVTFYKNILNNKQVTFMDFQSFLMELILCIFYHFLQKSFI